MIVASLLVVADDSAVFPLRVKTIVVSASMPQVPLDLLNPGTKFKAFGVKQRVMVYLLHSMLIWSWVQALALHINQYLKSLSRYTII